MTQPDPTDPPKDAGPEPDPKDTAPTDLTEVERKWKADNNGADLPAWVRDSISKANREAATHRTKLRDLEPLAQKAKELEESQKTEAQRLEERAATAEKTAADATSEALRLRVALANAPEGAKPEQILRAAKRLVGSNEEELAADAAEYFADFAGSKTPATRKPNERLRGGSDPDAEPEEDDPRKLAAAIAPRRL